MARENIPDAMIERAAALWARELRAPRFNNGGYDAPNLLANMLHAQTVAHIQKTDDVEMKIRAFEIELVRLLKFNRDHDGQPTGKNNERGQPETTWFEAFLDVDYHPCRTLATAAETVGLSSSMFSIKSRIYIASDCVSASWGYGAADVSHYPFDNGSWLICRLKGEDMSKIIEAVKAGLLPGLTVERPRVAD